MSMKFGTADVHLLGKMLDCATPERMAELGFTAGEIRRAEWIFEDVDAHLNDRVGLEWNDEEVA